LENKLKVIIKENEKLMKIINQEEDTSTVAPSELEDKDSTMKKIDDI
jgi:hypothetical protein